MAQAQAQSAPKRTQSSTSLSRFYNDGSNGGGPMGEEEMQDPRMDFCNAFWGQGDRGYEVVMARLRGAGRTLEELKAFWKERSAIEEDYARRLQKLSKAAMGKDEIGDLAAALQNCLVETAQQATYHQSLAAEIRTNVEHPTAELAARLVGFKKGQQAGIEKAWRNKGLQEGHVSKAREKYESDCLKLNSYTANQALTQGKEADKLQQKLEKIRQSIGQSEQDFRQFVRVLEGTQGKWEHEWKAFCDVVQDLEEDRLAMTKDIIWAFANAVSQVCVEDDSSCERVREKLELFEPQGDMVAFVRGWGTGDQIPDPPRFINYSAGEYPPHSSSHIANFQRETNKTPLAALSQYVPDVRSEPTPSEVEKPQSNGFSLHDGPNGSAPPPPSGNDKPKAPFGGVALPGMASASAQTPTSPPTTEALPKRYSSMGPPAPATNMTMPEPRVPSRQGPPSPAPNAQVDEEDPMAKALADLRTQPPSGSIRRGASHRRPESMYSSVGAASRNGSAVGRTQSPAPGTGPSNGNRMSYQTPPSGALSPPPAGHTAAALARSMDDFQRQSNKRGSVSYNNAGQDIVGAHPSSRSASPAPSGNGGRGPSSAMMQAPSQPATHVADGVLSQYHQAFPGERERERSRSRAGSVTSHVSGAGSFHAPIAPGPPASPTPREGFSGIGAGGRSPSPHPPHFASPGPSPNISGPGQGQGQGPGGMGTGNLGPQNMGIKLDAAGGVAQDSMAEAYRRQYQQQQGFAPPQAGGQGVGAGFGGYLPPRSDSHPQQPQQQQQQSYGAPSPAGPASVGLGLKSPTGPPPVSSQRPTSAYGQQPPQLHQQQSYQSAAPAQFGRPTSGIGSYSQGGHSGQSGYQQQPQSQQGGYQNAAAPPSGYSNSYMPGPGPAAPAPAPAPAMQHQPSYGGGGQYGGPQNPFHRAASPAPGPTPGMHQPPPQQQQYGRSASPAPPPQQQQQSRMQRSPSPQPGVAPVNAAPTGQWSTTGLPVLFYVKALYDYQALSAVEFDFQAGDIIAVTSTPDDGWWSGELLDEARRLPGRTDFPSNL
ncbi:uncharacterized protein MKK02DRAFT_22379 [Dioszegia hungarica]|uniref:Septation protein imp2 n=1 Tax=Dioszegia hungarica TaxID=4972 RepID=A0AA38HGJ7_9TREE|nr:uncharacterized protein MKK02DRAFT_22379 [Dioszegia hungarica]KAI9638499.1 hypothetical protein MKK02DRAFT_22379 [Dioszegia hungarica]